MNKLKWILIIIAGSSVALFFLIRIIVHLLMQSSPALGLEDGRLTDCPDYPACVSSQADPQDETHYVASIQNTLSVAEAVNKIKSIMSNMKGTELVTENKDYLHYEIKVAPFGFIDDVEFYFTGDRSPIELRSSARVPYYDFEVNRKRAEDLRNLFAAE